MEGLLFEVFREGCRISNVDGSVLAQDRNVTLQIEGFEDLPAQVHCTYDGVVRLRFVRPLSTPQLRTLAGNTRKRPTTFQPAVFFAA